MHIDVFNGDADGICALHQLRLSQPVDAACVTGLKREINLLERVSARNGDQLTVLDISLDKNREALLSILNTGAQIRYFDHHYAGEIPQHPGLDVHIDTSATTCTSLLVNQFLQGQYLPWAVVAAFGDNLYDSAHQAALPLNYTPSQLEQLQLLGTCINYNGYGQSLEDLFFEPEQLYRKLKPYPDPFDFIREEAAFEILRQGYQQDLAQADALEPERATEDIAVYFLPGAKWARRVAGVFANQLTREYPNRAHAILSLRHDEGFQVSVRAPLRQRSGADELCRQFVSGGGRQAAAGINRLPQSELSRFIQCFEQQYTL